MKTNTLKIILAYIIVAVLYVMFCIGWVLYWIGMILISISHLLRLEINSIVDIWSEFPQIYTNLAD